ncbi:hypothetical protein V8G54_027544 [Vigna mungo]|uniref:Uncharacterized protein n=1 Tax=Vigna mungo TaxID=3915 RepID=A0AAQ3N2V7_VIGMU
MIHKTALKENFAVQKHIDITVYICIVNNLFITNNFYIYLYFKASMTRNFEHNMCLNFNHGYFLLNLWFVVAYQHFILSTQIMDYRLQNLNKYYYCHIYENWSLETTKSTRDINVVGIFLT